MSVNGLEEYKADLVKSFEGGQPTSTEQYTPAWAADLRKSIETLEELLRANPSAFKGRHGGEDYDEDEEKDPFLKNTFTEEEIMLFTGRLNDKVRLTKPVKTKAKESTTAELLERVNALHARKTGKTKTKKKKAEKKDTTTYTEEELDLFERLAQDKRESVLGEGVPGMGRLKTPKDRASTGFVEPKTKQPDQTPVPKDEPRETYRPPGIPTKPGQIEERNTLDPMNRSNRGPEMPKTPLKPVETQFEQETTYKPTNEPVKSKQVITQEELERESKKPQTKEEKEIFSSKSITSKKLESNRRHVTYAETVKELRKQKKACNKR